MSTPVTASCGDPRFPPLIFLHGFLGCKEDWDEMVPFFSTRFHCIAIDLPGHGATPYSEDILGILRKAIPAMTGTKPVLMGYSMGGRIAMQLADLAAALVVLSAHPGLSTPEEREARLKGDRVWADRLLHLPFEVFLAEWYAQPVFQFCPMKHTLIERRKKQNPKDLARVLLQLSLAHQTPMDCFPCPAFFLYGEKDLKYQEILSRLSGTVKVRSIEGCSHVLHIENAPRCAQNILNWMESLYANT